MNKKYLNLWFLLLITYNICFSQNEKLGSRIILNTNNVSETIFYVYKPSFKAKVIYTNINEAKNAYPEELMSSILSANTQEWVNHNTLGGEKSTEKKDKSFLEKIKKYDKEKTYFELQAKLEFIANGNKMAIVKFYFHQQDKDKPVSGALVMQKNKDKWKLTSKPYTTSMAMVLMVFKPEILKRLLSNSPENEYEKKLLKNIYKDGFSFDALMKQKLSLEEKEYFTNPLNW
ncbi:hypothetical protein [Tenacibaculum maritimum]|uniref:hypothetical protein n=1 Tax=Tenacibaculum maritimum TaxID=107401 RepID=UPI003876E300